ncbi:MAG TPA: hypothetical protein VFF65_03040 [Phycisphaerales bacterium]|nr:hypothetical protein [Phycisphaerales bacterium]
MSAYRYTVELLDGRTFGPADAFTLREWAQQGRIPPLASIRGDDGSTCRAIDCEPIRDVITRVAAAPPTGAGELGAGAAPTDTAVSVVIPYRNAASLVGYYLGVFSLIPFIGIILAVPAIILGIVGMIKARTKPSAHGMVHGGVALALGVLSIVGHFLLFTRFSYFFR